MNTLHPKSPIGDEWIDIGAVDEVPLLGARIVKGPAGDISIFRASDDRIFALANRCPHRGGPLSEGIVHGHRVTCPLHNWRIEFENGTAVAPDQGCVPRYPVRVEEGRILLSLNPL